MAPISPVKEADSAVTLWPHPHDLVRRKPGVFSCFQSRACICSACGDRIPNRLPRYRCLRKDGDCPWYVLCEVCFNLGPGEGGTRLHSASFREDDKEFPMEVSTDAMPGLLGSPTPSSKSILGAEPPRTSVSSSGSFKDRPLTPASEGVHPEEDWPPEDELDSLPPRVAAARLDFNLPLDTEAQERWASFASSGGGTGGGGEIGAPESGQPLGDAAAMDAARRVAPALRFLQLSVLSRTELYNEQVARDKMQCLELYSPYAAVRPSLKERLLMESLAVPAAVRSIGALVGLALGDALGAPFEFIDAVDTVGGTRHYFNVSSFKNVGARNKFGVKPGQWTDDSAMALCLADTILARGDYVGSDSRTRYHNWWFRGYNNAFGNDDSRVGSVGLGGNVAKSLRCMRAGEIPDDVYKAVSEDAGNGTLMRLAPVPIFFSESPTLAAAKSAQSSAATHPGPIAAAACAFLGFAIARAIWREQDMSSFEFLDQVVNEFTELGMPGAVDCPELVRLLRSSEPQGKEESWNWRDPVLQVEDTLRARGSRYNGYPSSPGYFGSYCIDGLAIALWSFSHTESFTEAIARCTNFLGDADTTSAICGQLAGAFYGYGAMDPRMLHWLDTWDNGDIACRAALLYATRHRQAGPPEEKANGVKH